MDALRVGMLALALWAAGCVVRGQADPGPVFELGSRELAKPRAVLDWFGAMEITGRITGERALLGGSVSLRLTFPELQLPASGQHRLGGEADNGLAVTLDGIACTGTLTVERCTTERVVLRGELAEDAERRAFHVDLPVALATARIEGAKEGRAEPAPVDEADPADLVFCALGNTGTGAPVQRRIGASIAALAPSGPLSCVLLVGDLILPSGASKDSDPGFRRCFQEPYPDVGLPMPFYAALGDRDHQGVLKAYADYAAASTRLRIPHLAYQFTQTCRGKEILFVAVDTTMYEFGVRNPGMRGVNRIVTSSLRRSQAAVKIVFGHQSMFGSGDEGGSSELAEDLRTYLAKTFEDTGVDLYISGSPHHMELIETGRGFVEVVSGSGGGLVRTTTASEASRFATAEPGFTWFRYDGETIEVSFRTADGQVLHVHRMNP